MALYKLVQSLLYWKGRIMAKDGTARGGSRVRAGRKPKALADKVADGRKAKVLDLPEAAEFEGADVPPVEEYMKAKQSSGIDLCAKDVFESTYVWLKERGCEQLVNTQLINQYAMSVARWVQCEQCIGYDVVGCCEIDPSMMKLCLLPSFHLHSVFFSNSIKLFLHSFVCSILK